MKHSEIREKALTNPQVKAAFDEMAPEFARLREMLRARQSAGLSQAKVAERIGAKSLAVALRVTTEPVSTPPATPQSNTRESP